MRADALGSFEQLMAELKRLCAEGRTGTLFIATSENHAGQLGIRNGVVVAARFRLKTGLDAARGLARSARRGSPSCAISSSPPIRAIPCPRRPS
jgi:hypothetical protein